MQNRTRDEKHTVTARHVREEKQVEQSRCRGLACQLMHGGKAAAVTCQVRLPFTNSQELQKDKFNHAAARKKIIAQEYMEIRESG